MIEFFRNWCEQIIVAVIISIIIEAILPEGNHKKYVKVVIGIYIIFTILNPILGKLNEDIDFSKEFNLQTMQTSVDVDTENIRDLYANGIEQNLKSNIEEEFQVKINFLKITYDENYEEIENITLSIQNSSVVQIEKIEIGNQAQVDTQNKNDYPEVKNYIAENYSVDKNKININ